MAVVPRRRRGRGGRSLGPEPKGVASDGGNCHSARPLELWRFNLSANESGVEKGTLSRFFPCLGTVDISPPISNVCVRKSLARRILSKCGRSALLSSRVKTQSHPSVARFVVGLRELRAVTLEAMTSEKCMAAAPSPAASRIFRV